MRCCASNGGREVSKLPGGGSRVLSRSEATGGAGSRRLRRMGVGRSLAHKPRLERTLGPLAAKRAQTYRCEGPETWLCFTQSSSSDLSLCSLLGREQSPLVLVCGKYLVSDTSHLGSCVLTGVFTAQLGSPERSLTFLSLSCSFIRSRCLPSSVSGLDPGNPFWLTQWSDFWKSLPA